MNVRDQTYNIFNGDGKLIQVEYGLEAVYNSYQAVSVMCDSAIVNVSKKVPKPALKIEEHTSLYKISDNIYLNITGMPADVAYIVSRSRTLASSKEYSLGCTLLPDVFTTSLADKFQALIQRSGKRAPAFASAVIGFENGKPLMYYTDISAVAYPCYAVAMGEDHNKMTKYLEKNYKKGESEESMISLAISTLLESIGHGAEHSEIEVTILREDGVEYLSGSRIEVFLQKIAENNH